MQKCKNTKIQDPTLPSLPTTPITRIKARALISLSPSHFWISPAATSHQEEDTSDCMQAGDLGVHPRSRSCLLRLHQTGEETSSPCVGRCQDRPVLLWPSAHRLATVGAQLQLTNTTPWMVDQLPLTNCK